MIQLKIVLIRCQNIVDTFVNGICVHIERGRDEEALLVMIRYAVVDGAGAVELFEEEEVGQVVGGGHGGEGKAEVGAGFEGF